MHTIPAHAPAHVLNTDWVTFSGGELEGQRPRTLCRSCRVKLHQTANSKLRRAKPAPLPLDPPAGQASRPRQGQTPLCFECYRAELVRERALKAAGDLDTASEERFQFALPLEPVDHTRLEQLKVARRAERAAQSAASPYVDRRRQAQINARHVLQRLADGLRARSAAEQRQGMAAATHAADVQLPVSWLPFVASR
jgi:hypothetical protein